MGIVCLHVCVLCVCVCVLCVYVCAVSSLFDGGLVGTDRASGGRGAAGAPVRVKSCSLCNQHDYGLIM